MIATICSFIVSHPLISGFLMYWAAGSYLKGENRYVESSNDATQP